MNKIKTAHSIPTGLAITKLSKFNPTKPTTFSRLLETKLLKFSQNLQSQPRSLSLFLSFCVTSIYTQPIHSYLKQTNFSLLSKLCNLHLQSVTFRRRALNAMQKNQYQIMLCHSTATCWTFSLSSVHDLWTLM